MKKLPKDQLLYARAVARWENEGGAVPPIPNSLRKTRKPPRRPRQPESAKPAESDPR